MKTLKMFQIALVIIALSVLIGCSDQLMSPEISSTESKGLETLYPGSVKLSGDKFTAEIELKPYGSYTFDYSNTGFVKIVSINAEIVTAKLPTFPECKNLIVYSSNSDLKLRCNSSGFSVKEITVENATGETVRISVTLTGRIRIIEPDDL